MTVALSVNERRATWICCLLASVVTGVVLLITRTAVAVGPLLLVAGCVLGMLGLHVLYTRWRLIPTIGAMTAGLAALIWAGVSAGILALAALRVGAPFVDASLAHADALLHVNTSAVLAWVSRHVLLGKLLEIAYLSTVPAVFATVLFLATRCDTAPMWELCFAFAAGSFLSALALLVAPATAAFAYYDMGPQVTSALPSGAGRFFLPVLLGFQSGALDTINVFQLEGLERFRHSMPPWRA